MKIEKLEAIFLGYTGDQQPLFGSNEERDKINELIEAVNRLTGEELPEVGPGE